MSPHLTIIYVTTVIGCNKIHKCQDLNNGFYMLAKTDRSQRSHSRPYEQALEYNRI